MRRMVVRMSASSADVDRIDHVVNSHVHPKTNKQTKTGPTD